MLRPRWLSISEVIVAVFAHFEGAEKAEELAAHLQVLLVSLCILIAADLMLVGGGGLGVLQSLSSGVKVTTELPHLLEEVFTKNIGLESRTFRVFQAIHQSNVVLLVATCFWNAHRSLSF